MTERRGEKGGGEGEHTRDAELEMDRDRQSDGQTGRGAELASLLGMPCHQGRIFGSHHTHPALSTLVRSPPFNQLQRHMAFCSEGFN